MEIKVGSELATSGDATNGFFIKRIDFNGVRILDLLQMNIYNATHPYGRGDLGYRLASHDISKKSDFFGESNGLTLDYPLYKIEVSGLYLLVERPAAADQIIYSATWRFHKR